MATLKESIIRQMEIDLARAEERRDAREAEGESTDYLDKRIEQLQNALDHVKNTDTVERLLQSGSYGIF